MKKIMCKRVVTILMSLVLAGCQNTASSSSVMEEGKKTGYILKDDNIIALIGYRE